MVVVGNLGILVQRVIVILVLIRIMELTIGGSVRVLMVDQTPEYVLRLYRLRL